MTRIKYHSSLLLMDENISRTKSETASGIWYQRFRNKLNSPVALKGFKSPNGLRDLLENDIQNSNEVTRF